MKHCPRCKRVAPDDVLDFCRADGARLVDPAVNTDHVSSGSHHQSQGDGAPTQKLRQGPAIAVLPFANMSPDAENDYFCDGLAEELLSALSKVEGLKVAARTSSFSFKGKEAAVATIGEVLKVNTLLGGSVRKSGNRLRVTVQLINTEDGYHLWSERYDRRLDDVFEVQDEITSAVVGALKLKLLGRGGTRRYAGSIGAYDLYLKGRHLWGKRPQPGLVAALEYFRRAIEVDPAFAPAHAGLADAYAVLGSWETGLLPPKEAAAKARSAALKALEIDPELAEAHASLAYVDLHYDWDWAAAEQGFKRALELSPNYVHAHHWYAHHCMAMGRVEEAFTAGLRALELDPLDPIVNVHMAWHHWLAREPDRALERCAATMGVEPGSPWAHFFAGLAYELKAMYEEAIRELRAAEGLSSITSTATAGLGHACGLAGCPDQAEGVLSRLRRRADGGYVPAYDLAVVNVGLGRVEDAFACLERACEERSSWMSYLNVEPRLDPLRADPRFAELVRSVGLPR